MHRRRREEATWRDRARRRPLVVLDLVWVRRGAHARGLGAAADTGVERVDRGDLVRAELKVEDVDVLRDPVRLYRLRDRAEAMFDVSAQNDLRRGLAVLLRELYDDAVLEHGRLLWPVGVHPADRRPRLGRDSALGH
jgi:hypothetical protein